MKKLFFILLLFIGVELNAQFTKANSVPFPAFGTNNYGWLTISGTSGQVLTSAGSGTVAPTWTTPSSVSWSLLGNSGLTDGVNFIGTTSAAGDKQLNFRVNNVPSGRIDQNSGNTFFGYNTGVDITTGLSNTAIGDGALTNGTSATFNVAIGVNALGSATVAIGNTAVGESAMSGNLGGGNNVAIGRSALNGNLIGNSNTAVGMNSLSANTADGNTAVGLSALSFNTTGIRNVAVGFDAATQSATVNDITAIGYGALASNTVGENTAVGSQSLTNNTTGTLNTAMGFNSMNQTTDGGENTALGHNALFSNSNGAQNVAIGNSALYTTNGQRSVAVGSLALTQAISNNNTAVGFFAMKQTTNGGNNTAIGYASGNGNQEGTNNTFLGYQADALIDPLDNATAVGANAIVGASNSMVLGNGVVNVGIGISSPTALLHAVGTNTIVTNFVLKAVGSDNKSGIFVNNAGQIYGGNIHNNPNAVTGTVNQYIASGTYTPTTFTVTNTAAATPAVCQWIRVGNVVTVSGEVQIDIVTTLAASEIEFTLPIASALTATTQLGGIASIANIEQTGNIKIRASIANDRAELVWINQVTTANQTYSFTFTYLIL